MTSGASGGAISGLAALFGVSYDGKVDTQVHNSYLNVEKDPR